LSRVRIQETGRQSRFPNVSVNQKLDVFMVKVRQTTNMALESATDQSLALENR
jgi:hypothetical protein